MRPSETVKVRPRGQKLLILALGTNGTRLAGQVAAHKTSVALGMEIMKHFIGILLYLLGMLGSWPVLAQELRPDEAGPPPLPPPVPRLLISEIQVNPLLHDDRAGEFVEIVNLSHQPVRLTDLTLLLPSGLRGVPVRPRAPLLQPAEVVILTPLGSEPGEAAVRGMRLPNDSGRLELFWRHTRVDVVQWHKKAPWPKPQPGRSLERQRPGSAGTEGRTWRLSAVVLNGIERASPGRVDWLCTDVAGTALEGHCVPTVKAKKQQRCGKIRQQRQHPHAKTGRRALEHMEIVWQRSLGGDLNPRPNDYESFALTT